MNHQEFDELVKDRMARCILTLCAKGEEYSRGGDRLYNFKRAAEKRGCTPAEALLGMKVKHDVSVDDMVTDLAAGKVPSKEHVDEKIGDSINYILLLLALIEEARNQQPSLSQVLTSSQFCIDDTDLPPNSLGNLCRRQESP